MNQGLKEHLEEEFKPLGIIAWSGCCRLGCTGSYDEGDANFQLRDRGITYFKLFLSGMNYDSRPDSCYVQYTDLDYLNDNWDTEEALIHKWCSIVGLHPGAYNVERPKDENTAIGIHFNRHLVLDYEPDEEYEEDEEDEEDEERQRIEDLRESKKSKT